jgi:polyhydroxyalkanoate synthesis regulator phasin
MKDTIRKVGLFGIGAWALTEEKITEFVNDLVDKGEINREEGKKFVNELISARKKQKVDLEQNISAKVQDMLGKADLATKKEIKSIEDKIDNLEAAIKELSKED